MRREPTEKQRLFLKGKLEGKSSNRAALDAGYSPSVAQNAKADILSKPGIYETFLAAMEKAGITDDKIAQTVEDVMKDKDNPAVRLKAAQYANEVKGINPTKKFDLTTNGEAINKITVTDDPDPEYLKWKLNNGK